VKEKSNQKPMNEFEDPLAKPRQRIGQIFGSSKEFVGEVRHRQFANCMKKHDSLSLIRVESV
jgi:hypothetical protein